MTAHGVGMVGTAGFAGAAIMWYFVKPHLQLSTGIFVVHMILFVLGVVILLVGGVFLGNFGGGWTFLFPLPAISGEIWGKGPAALYMIGLLFVGTGFLLLYLDVARGVINKFGSLGGGLGWPQLFGKTNAPPPPPPVVASTMVLIVNTIGIIAGATVLTMSLTNLYDPAYKVDALLAKNLTYFFGHVFINASIYMAIIAVYEILPRYTHRPWKSSPIFLAAWTASTVMVILAYAHHLLMDFAMPGWMLIMGQVISYLSGLPVLAVTALGTLTIVYRSGIRWDVASSFLFLGVFGWAAGVLPAIVDATIVVNYVMHNTMWVPGHFHFYLLLGLVPMILGFIFHLAKSEGGVVENFLDRLAFWGFSIGGLVFVLSLLAAGMNSMPRRWAVHLPEWTANGQFASVFAGVAVCGMLIFFLRLLAIRIK